MDSAPQESFEQQLGSPTGSDLHPQPGFTSQGSFASVASANPHAGSDSQGGFQRAPHKDSLSAWHSNQFQAYQGVLPLIQEQAQAQGASGGVNAQYATSFPQTSNPLGGLPGQALPPTGLQHPAYLQQQAALNALQQQPQISDQLLLQQQGAVTSTQLLQQMQHRQQQQQLLQQQVSQAQLNALYQQPQMSQQMLLQQQSALNSAQMLQQMQLQQQQQQQLQLQAQAAGIPALGLAGAVAPGAIPGMQGMFPGAALPLQVPPGGLVNPLTTSLGGTSVVSEVQPLPGGMVNPLHMSTGATSTVSEPPLGASAVSGVSAAAIPASASGMGQLPLGTSLGQQPALGPMAGAGVLPGMMGNLALNISQGSQASMPGAAGMVGQLPAAPNSMVGGVPAASAGLGGMVGQLPGNSVGQQLSNSLGQLSASSAMMGQLPTASGGFGQSVGAMSTVSQLPTASGGFGQPGGAMGALGQLPVNPLNQLNPLNPLAHPMAGAAAAGLQPGFTPGYHPIHGNALGVNPVSLGVTSQQMTPWNAGLVNGVMPGGMNPQQDMLWQQQYQQQQYAIAQQQLQQQQQQLQQQQQQLQQQLSHAGSRGGSGSVDTPTARSTASMQIQQGNQRKVKMVCSTGGHFCRTASGGGTEYQGGETRLVSVPNYCSYTQLLESLEKMAGNLNMQTSQQSDLAPILKYQLPGNPNVFVDIIDDTDVQEMFEEWQEYVSGEGKTSNKLHTFVDWNKFASVGRGSEQRLGSISETDVASEKSDIEEQGAPPQGTSAGSAGGGSTQLSPKLGHTDSGFSEYMDIIDPADISLVKFLGSGGYGEVYLAKWHNSDVAVKCLNPSLFYQGGVEDPENHPAALDLKREANLLGKLHHPNVVWVYGVVWKTAKRSMEDSEELTERTDSADAIELAAAMAQSSGRSGQPGQVRPPAIVTEYMAQGSLKAALSRKAEIVQGPLIKVLIAMDAAKGMEYLHDKRIVHFDLKSANLLLGYRDRRAVCKVADFGLSKQKGATYVTGVSSQRGTLPWIAPEIIKTPHAVTEKVDVYSFGVVLWELWSCREPYDGLNYHALLHQITSANGCVRPPLPGSPEWEGEYIPEVAPGWADLVQRCWGEDPKKRPSFREIVQELKRMAQALRPPPRRRSTPSLVSGAMPPSSATTGSRKPSSVLAEVGSQASEVKQPGDIKSNVEQEGEQKGTVEQKGEQKGTVEPESEQTAANGKQQPNAQQQAGALASIGEREQYLQPDTQQGSAQQQSQPSNVHDAHGSDAATASGEQHSKATVAEASKAAAASQNRTHAQDATRTGAAADSPEQVPGGDSAGPAATREGRGQNNWPVNLHGGVAQHGASKEKQHQPLRAPPPPAASHVAAAAVDVQAELLPTAGSSTPETAASAHAADMSAAISGSAAPAGLRGGSTEGQQGDQQDAEDEEASQHGDTAHGGRSIKQQQQHETDNTTQSNGSGAHSGSQHGSDAVQGSKQSTRSGLPPKHANVRRLADTKPPTLAPASHGVSGDTAGMPSTGTGTSQASSVYSNPFAALSVQERQVSWATEVPHATPSSTDASS